MLLQSLSVTQNLVGNNRPICLTSLVVKTMERIILSRLTDILTANGLLIPTSVDVAKAILQYICFLKLLMKY